ncbi:hypothetical protein [Streptomyces sp. NPDC014656]|uniref:hypothetical protein n=1 Tax=Streptomyces sp. NPDC014656 TaxID=3364878 RepID=UPI0036F706C6
MARFTLLEVALFSEDRGRLSLLPAPEGRLPVELPDGGVMAVSLTFRVGEQTEGLAYEEERRRDGQVVMTSRHLLGGFRPGGPYEIRLPAERLPVGRANCATYEVTGRFVDAEGHELARERQSFELVHRSPHEWHGARRSHHRAATAAASPWAAGSAGRSGPEHSPWKGDGHGHPAQ